MKTRKNILAFAGMSLVAMIMAACSHPSKSAASRVAASSAGAARPALSSGLAATLPPSNAAPLSGTSLWRSDTTGNEYRVTIHGDRLVANWVNLPPAAARRGSYIRTACMRKGSKWVGTSAIFIACSLGEGRQEHVANTCHLRMKIEFDTVTKNLITGRGQGLTKFDCRTCKVLAAGWGNFKWVRVR